MVLKNIVDIIVILSGFVELVTKLNLLTMQDLMCACGHACVFSTCVGVLQSSPIVVLPCCLYSLKIVYICVKYCSTSSHPCGPFYPITIKTFVLFSLNMSQMCLESGYRKHTFSWVLDG